MKTRAWKLLALVLALALVLTGCNLIEVDPEKDNAEVVASVNDEKITKGDVKDTYDYYLSYYSYLYQYYYGNSDISSEKDKIKDSVLESFIETKLVAQKAAELGLDQLTDEDLAKISENAQATLDEYIEEHKDDVDTEGMPDEEAREAVIKHLEEEGLTMDVVTESEKTRYIADRVRESVIADVTVEDSEIEEAYNTKVSENETSLSASSYLFEMYHANGTTVYWNPEGYRTVKHILLMASDDQKKELSDLTSELKTVTDDLAKLEAPAEDAEATPEATATPDPEATAEPALTKEELEAKKADLEKQIADKKQEILDSLQDKIDEVNAALESGKSFDDVMAEFGEDPGMKSEPSMTTGYYVSANSTYWEDVFTQTAMALEKIGDVSDPVVGSNGVHIIYYNSDVTAGAVPLDEVRDELSAELLSTKQDETYDAAYQSWYNEAKIKKYPNRLD